MSLNGRHKKGPIRDDHPCLVTKFDQSRLEAMLLNHNGRRTRVIQDSLPRGQIECPWQRGQSRDPIIFRFEERMHL